MRASSTTVLDPFVTNPNTLTIPAQLDNNLFSRARTRASAGAYHRWEAGTASAPQATVSQPVPQDDLGRSAMATGITAPAPGLAPIPTSTGGAGDGVSQAQR